MAMEAGDATAGTGLAGAIAAKMSATFGKDFDVKKAAAGLNAMAAAVVEYIQANAEVSLSGSDPASVE